MPHRRTCPTTPGMRAKPCEPQACQLRSATVVGAAAQYGSRPMWAEYTVPSDFNCSGGNVVGRWVWKTCNSCNDYDNVRFCLPASLCLPACLPACRSEPALSAGGPEEFQLRQQSHMCPWVCRSFGPSVRPSVRPSVCLSVCLFVCRSVRPCCHTEHRRLPLQPATANGRPACATCRSAGRQRSLAAPSSSKCCSSTTQAAIGSTRLGVSVCPSVRP